jgi:hypothetical protein
MNVGTEFAKDMRLGLLVIIVVIIGSGLASLAVLASLSRPLPWLPLGLSGLSMAFTALGLVTPVSVKP